MANQFAAQYAALSIPAPKAKDLSKKAEVIYEAACKKLGLDPADLPDVSKVREKYRASQLAFHKLEVIRDAITGDREADWNNSREYRWFSWFYQDAPGFRFRGADYRYAASLVGSRLCFFSEEDARAFAPLNGPDEVEIAEARIEADQKELDAEFAKIVHEAETA